jgi:hypothetical protein
VTVPSGHNDELSFVVNGGKCTEQQSRYTFSATTPFHGIKSLEELKNIRSRCALPILLPEK